MVLWQPSRRFPDSVAIALATVFSLAAVMVIWLLIPAIHEPPWLILGPGAILMLALILTLIERHQLSGQAEPPPLSLRHFISAFLEQLMIILITTALVTLALINLFL